jgi:hypothetical protein
MWREIGSMMPSVTGNEERKLNGVLPECRLSAPALLSTFYSHHTLSTRLF